MSYAHTQKRKMIRRLKRQHKHNWYSKFVEYVDQFKKQAKKEGK